MHTFPFLPAFQMLSMAELIIDLSVELSLFMHIRNNWPHKKELNPRSERKKEQKVPESSTSDLVIIGLWDKTDCPGKGHGYDKHVNENKAIIWKRLIFFNFKKVFLWEFPVGRDRKPIFLFVPYTCHGQGLELGARKTTEIFHMCSVTQRLELSLCPTLCVGRRLESGASGPMKATPLWCHGVLASILTARPGTLPRKPKRTFSFSANILNKTWVHSLFSF